MPEGLLHDVPVDETFSLGGMSIRPFAISHDAKEPSGYRIENETKSVAVATDLGKYDEYTVEHLKDLNAVVLEANHDIHMLEVVPIPILLKGEWQEIKDICQMNCQAGFFVIYCMTTFNMWCWAI